MKYDACNSKKLIAKYITSKAKDNTKPPHTETFREKYLGKTGFLSLHLTRNKSYIRWDTGKEKVNMGFVTSSVEKIEINESIIFVTTQFSIYVFQKESEPFE